MTEEIPLLGGDVLLDELLAQRRSRLERGDWRVTPRRVIVENLPWLEENRAELATFLV